MRLNCISTFVCLLAGTALSSPALAQTASADDAANPAGEIMVTGSRLKVSGSDTPTPVTMNTAQQLDMASPTNLADGLNQLPQFMNSSSDTGYFQTNANEPFSGNYLNLRGIGPERALILLDGRRVVSTSFRGTVDVNSLPQMLVDRVDVVTAGASAAYGSDAVSGVVNYVLNKKFTGIKAEGSAGISSRGDAGTQRLGVAVGTDLLDGRLHLMFSAEHFQRKGLDSRSDRRYGDDGYLMTGAGNASDPYRLSENVRYNNSSFGGLITSGALKGYVFNSDGSVRPFEHGSATGTAGLESGGDGTYWANISLTGGLKTDQAFGRADFEITPSVNFHVQGGYARAVNDSHQAPDYRFSNVTIFAENAYLTPELSAATGGESFKISRINRDFGPNDAHAVNETLNVTTGLEGDFGDWSWSFDYTYGRNVLRTRATEVENSKFYAAVDAVDDGSGNIVCRVTLTNPGLYPGCVPLNIMGEGTPSQAAIDYIKGDSLWRALNRLDVAAGNISGKPFETWAGPVAVAFGAEYRRQSLTLTSNSAPDVAVDFTGLRGASGRRFNFTNVGTAAGSYNVKEAYGEISIPVLRDSSLGRSLELNGALRYTDYSTSGGVATWKLGAVYEPFSSLRLRVTRSRDIRAPTLYDLFSTRSTNTVTATDLSNPSAGVQIVNASQSGNPGLKPEVGNTLSVGLVLQPTFLPRFHATIDYYDLKVSGAIVTTSAQQQIQDCYDAGGNAPVCDTITRDPTTGLLTDIQVTPLNLAKRTVRGVDMEVGYNFDFGTGSLDARALLSYIDSFTTQQSATSTVIQAAGTANTGNVIPRFRGNLQLTYTNGPFSAFVQERWIDGIKRSTQASAVYADGLNTIKDVFYTDLTLQVGLGPNHDQQLFLTVNNLFDRQAPLAAYSGSPALVYPTYQSAYDIIGRTLTAGFRVKF